MPVLHDDDPTAPGNLTAEEYARTYADGTPCGNIPADVLQAVEVDAVQQQTGQGGGD